MLAKGRASQSVGVIDFRRMSFVRPLQSGSKNGDRENTAYCVILGAVHGDFLGSLA